jgi:serine protease Do
MGDLNDTIAEELQIEDRAGAFIYNVYGESPAMEGGILPGDLIISMAGRTVEDSDDLSRTVASLSPGEEVPVRLIRNGNTVSINIPLAVRTIERDGMKVNVWPGFSVVPVTSDIRDQMRIPRNAGNVLIGGVVNDSAASALGLRSGDVIKSINRRNVRDLKDFYDRINTDDRLEIKVVRQGHELEFILNK